MEHEVKFISRKPETVLWLFVGSQTEDFSCHLPDGYFPHFYVTYGRIGIAECVVCIMSHDDIQCTAFIVYLLDEFHLPPTHRAFGTHTVTAGYLFVLVDKFMSEAESDTYIIIMFQHL